MTLSQSLVPEPIASASSEKQLKVQNQTLELGPSNLCFNNPHPEVYDVC